MADSDVNENRRTFVTAATAAGLLGAVALGAENVQAQGAQASNAENPKAPPGLKATPDLRYPLCYKAPVTEGVRALMDYFAAFSERNARGMANAMHFPYGTYEGTNYVVVKSEEDLMSHPPASMDFTIHPERFTDHDGYLKAGAYAVFVGAEVLISDPISATMSLTYDNYGPDGKKMLRCEGIYSATNNNGRWALQEASTIFTPAAMIGVTYPDAMAAAKRLRIDHDLQYSVGEQFPNSVPPWPTWHPSDAPPISSHTYHSMHLPGGVMSLFRVKGVKSRVSATPRPPESITEAGPPVNWAQYRDTFNSLGLGPWGWVFGTSRSARIIHQTVDKVHFTACAARYTATGEEINADTTVAIATYKGGYWRLGGGMGYGMTHDRGNDV